VGAVACSSIGRLDEAYSGSKCMSETKRAQQSGQQSSHNQAIGKLISGSLRVLVLAVSCRS